MEQFRPNVVLRGVGPAWAEDRWPLLRLGDTTFRCLQSCPRCQVRRLGSAARREAVTPRPRSTGGHDGSPRVASHDRDEAARRARVASCGCWHESGPMHFPTATILPGPDVFLQVHTSESRWLARAAPASATARPCTMPVRPGTEHRPAGLCGAAAALRAHSHAQTHAQLPGHAGRFSPRDFVNRKKIGHVLFHAGSMKHVALAASSTWPA